MSDAHQFVAWSIVAVTATLAIASVWSALDARRSGDAAGHRFLVDRLILVVVAAVLLNVAIGGILLATGQRPGDVLHLLYGSAAAVILPIGWQLATGGRRATPPRGRRDGWLVVAAVVLLGLELRLFMTG